MKKTVILLIITALIASLLPAASFAAAEAEYVLLGDLTPCETDTIDGGVYFVNETGMTPGVNINIGGCEYEYGVSFHPSAEKGAWLTYDVEELGYKTFYAVAGKDLSSGRDVGGANGIKGTQISTAVYVDGVLAAESGALGYPDTYTYTVDIEGAKKVKLFVSDEDGLYCDTTSWGNALFSKAAAGEFEVPEALRNAVATPEPTAAPTEVPTNPPEVKDMDMIYLSDIVWRAAEMYSGAHDGVPTKDENVAEEEIWICGEYFEKGVVVHARSGSPAFIEVDLTDLGFKSFVTYIGTAESQQYDVTMASVQFVFYADGVEKYRSGTVRAADEASKVYIDVSDCKIFRIEVLDGGDGISGDWAALGSARFSKADNEEEAWVTPTPAPTPEPTPSPAASETVKPSETAKPAADDSSSKKNSSAGIIVAIAAGAAVIGAVIAVIAKKKGRK